jgi:hypothetical protein
LATRKKQERNKEKTNKQTNKQATGKQTNNQTQKQTDKETNKQTHKETERKKLTNNNPTDQQTNVNKQTNAQTNCTLPVSCLVKCLSIAQSHPRKPLNGASSIWLLQQMRQHHCAKPESNERAAQQNFEQTICNTLPPPAYQGLSLEHRDSQLWESAKQTNNTIQKTNNPAVVLSCSIETCLDRRMSVRYDIAWLRWRNKTEFILSSSRNLAGPGPSRS